MAIYWLQTEGILILTLLATGQSKIQKEDLRLRAQNTKETH